MLHALVLAHYGFLSNDDVVYDKMRLLCPFHDDHKPSCDFDELGFKCWACGASGSLYDLIKYYEKLEGNALNDWQAILKLAQIKRTKTFKVKSKEKIKVNEKESLLFARKFVESLHTPQWDRLTYHTLIARGIYPSTLIHEGVRLNVSSSHPIIFPVYQGEEFRGYIARRDDEKVDPKYINNTGMCKKSIVHSTMKKGPVLVVEGEVDRLKAIQFGWENTTAIFGWDISETQVQTIQTYATSVIDGLDNDVQGRKGGEKLRKVFSDLNVYRFPMFETKDIGAMNKQQFFYSESRIY